MEIETGLAFLKAIGSPRVSTRKDGQGRVHLIARCPLAPWTHGKGKDSTPAFSLMLKEGTTALTNCFACGHHSDAYGLIMLMEHLQSRADLRPAWDYGLARALARDEERPPAKVASVDDLLAPPEKVSYAFPEEMLEALEPAWHDDEVHPYLATRGVDATTARLWDLRYDAKRRRVVTPIRDFGGTLMGLHGRAVDPTNSLRWLAYTYPEKEGRTNRHILLGEHRFRPDRPLLVVESVFDLLRVFPIWSNVVSPTAATFPKEVFKRLDGVAQVITLFDADDAGDVARHNFKKALGPRCSHATLPAGYKDPGETSPEILARILETFSSAVQKPKTNAHIQIQSHPTAQPEPAATQ